MRLPAVPSSFYLAAIGAFLAASPAPAQVEAPEAPPALEVRRLRSGPVCEAGSAEVGRAPSDRICPGRDVHVRGLDTCVFDGEEVRCTWWGFEFDYANADPGEPLTCVWTRSRSIDEGNWEDVRKRGVAADTVQFAFESESGHLFFPGFDTLPDAGFTAPWLTVDMEYDCAHRGRRAFVANYRLIFSSAFE